jgi:tetratricopeptide (TPR) repeat protein
MSASTVSFNNFVKSLLLILLGLSLGITTWNLGGTYSITLISVSYINAFIILLLGVVISLSEDWKWFLNPTAYLLLPFLMLCGVHAFTSPTAWIAKREANLYLQGIIFYWSAFYLSKDYKALQKLLMIILGVAFMSCMAAFYQYGWSPRWVPMHKLSPGYVGRCSGTLGIPNTFAGLMLLGLFLALAVSFCSSFSKTVRIFALISAICFDVGIFLSISRAAIIIHLCVIGCLSYFLIETPKKRHIFWVVFILMFICGSCLIPQTIKTFGSRFNDFLSNTSSFSRFYLWKAAFKIFLDHPIWGSGLSSYSTFFEKYRPEPFESTPLWAHNDYLNTLSDLGLVGFLLFFGCVIYLSKKGFNQWGYLKNSLKRPLEKDLSRKLTFEKTVLAGSLISIFAFCLHLCFEFHLKIPALFFYFCMYLGIISGLSLREASLSHFDDYTHAATIRYIWVGGCLFLSVCLYATCFMFKANSLVETGKKKLNQVVQHRIPIQMAPVYLNEASALFEEAIRIDPLHAEAFNNLSYALYMSNLNDLQMRRIKGEQAYTYAYTALSLCDTKWEFWSQCGLSLLLQNKLQAAAPYFETVIQLAPNNANAWYYYASFLKTQNKRQDLALKAIERSLYLNPESHQARVLKNEIVYLIRAVVH